MIHENMTPPPRMTGHLPSYDEGRKLYIGP